MSVNKHKPHVYLIPEDRAEAQIAQGFARHINVSTRQLQIVEEAGGWLKVLETFKEVHLSRLRQNQHSYVIMLIDFDERKSDNEKSQERLAKFKSEIPNDVQSRVFVIGPKKDPQVLKRQLQHRSLEDIGMALANDCDGNTSDIWNHPHLQHNEDERLRPVETVKPFLFN